MRTNNNWSKHIPFMAIALLFAMLAVGYSVVNPLHEATDEIRHYRYVRHLQTYHSLPVQAADQPRAQSHHPPLYYALAALASAWVKPDHEVYFAPLDNPYWNYRYWEVGVDNKNQYVHTGDEDFPYRGDALIAHIARWVNVLIGLVTVALTYKLGCIVFPQQPAMALGATAFVAFNPMFLYMSAAINNDVIAALAGVAVTALCASVIAGGITLRRAAGLGLLYGLALMSKFNLAFIVALIELTLLAALWAGATQPRAGGQPDRRVKQWLAANLVILAVASLVSGWWFVRNMVLYGEPTGVQKVADLWGVRDPFTSLPVAWSEWPYAWTSLWGRFGYGQIPMPEWTYTALKLIAGLGLVGLGRQGLRLWRARPVSPVLLAQLDLLAATALSFAAVLFGYMLVSPAGAMGRFFFPALPALSLLLFYGLSAWLPAHQAGRLAWGCLAGMAALSLYALTGVLAPAYARPQPLSASDIAAIAQPVQATFGQQARLLGYDLKARQLSPGDEFDLTVYWQALAPGASDLTIFVHLISQAGPLAAQRDTYPGLGRFPAAVWRAGDTFSDRYRIVLDDYTYTPDVADVVVGLVVPGQGRLPVSAAAGQSLGTGVTLTQVTLAPRPGAYPNPVEIRFDDKIALVGYALDARSLQAGQSIRLTLYWQALRPMEYEYRVFAQVLGEDYRRWAANDGFPNTSPKRTWKWQPGWVYQDVRTLTIAPDTPPGIYPITLGLFGGPDDERLSVLSPDGRPLSDHLQLTHIRVQ